MHQLIAPAGLLFVVLLTTGCASTGRATPQPFGDLQTSCVGTTSSDLTVYDAAQVDERPTARVLSELDYPRDARREGIGGRVMVSAIINQDGRAEDSSIAVVESVHPLLDAEAMRFVREAHLWPACRARQPVRVKMNVPVEFVRSSPIPSAKDAFIMSLVGGSVGIVAALIGR